MIRDTKSAVRWLLFAGVLAAFGGCRHAPDEAQVREAIARTAQAAEAADAGGVVDSIGENFDGNDGEFDRSRLANLVRLIGLRGDHIGVTLGPVDVTHRGDRLLADFSVTLTSGGRLLPAELGIYKVRTAWRRVDGRLVCYWAHWTRSL
jgi:hypothetical protein